MSGRVVTITAHDLLQSANPRAMTRAWHKKETARKTPGCFLYLSAYFDRRWTTTNVYLMRLEIFDKLFCKTATFEWKVFAAEHFCHQKFLTDKHQGAIHLHQY
ncbi:hypothetical protein PMI13_01084 [Chryseobacterium populi]|uniref:Uncharacterized protein n=1 Tax=Chryseobacterium populi TaxID=1144316 RepID=J2K2G3_9FLAO|nr:hypothetical protein PMI13_01084 [Chryseobacterium populi]